MKTICCPKCGEPLEQGQYWYDTETDTMRVDHCPMCECEYGEPCEIRENEQIMNNCINTYIFEAMPRYEIPANLFVRSTPKDYGEYLAKKGKKRNKKK